MTRRRTHLFQKKIDNNYMSDKDSIVLPSNVRRILAVCPDMENGRGYISIFTETSENCLINQMQVADDNAHFNSKNIEVFDIVEGCNLYYVFELTETDISKPCTLKILITYEEEE